MQTGDIEVKENPLLKISDGKISFNILITRGQIPTLELIDIIQYLNKREEGILLFVTYDEEKNLFSLDEQKEMWKSLGIIFDGTNTILQEFEYKKPYIESFKDAIETIINLLGKIEEPVFWIREEQEMFFKNYVIGSLLKNKNIKAHYGVVRRIDNEPITSVSEVLNNYFTSESFSSKDSIENYTDIRVCETIDKIMEKYQKGTKDEN